jgi:hypothetical protein
MYYVRSWSLDFCFHLIVVSAVLYKVTFITWFDSYHTIPILLSHYSWDQYYYHIHGFLWYPCSV